MLIDLQRYRPIPSERRGSTRSREITRVLRCLFTEVRCFLLERPLHFTVAVEITINNAPTIAIHVIEKK